MGDKLLMDYDFIISGSDLQSCVRFTFIDAVSERYPSIAFAVEAVDHSFSGANKDLWFAQDEIRSFLLQIKTLVRTMEGKASLRSMSPDEFDFNVERTGDRFVVAYAIKTIRYSGNVLLHTQLQGTFEIEPEEINRLQHKLATVKQLLISQPISRS
ncbi:hypothetical protein ACF3MZ_10370 [Paenibacillaceae bacterium WGS1546]|uniref:hypothetical protein n=1 Tax=Cohnella sp. WGS1546 TaxID=3366810 RepID=UPI00372CFD20